MKKFNIFNKIVKVSQVIGLGIILYFFINIFSSYKNSEEKNKELAVNSLEKSYKISAIEIPNKLYFANENVPLEDISVKESIDREFLVNTYWQSQTLLFLKRSNRFFQIIEPILKQNGIPDDFKYLAVIESGLSNVVSPSGAKGFWQFLKNTAKEYKLEVNTQVDERYNLEKATQAACEYFNESYRKFGNWTLVAASYNMGKVGLAKQMKRQKESDYYHLLLNSETGRYIYRIIAVKEILSNPEKYGFYVEKKQLYPFVKTTEITVDSAISNLADFAHEQSISYKVLKLYNPWLRDNILTNKRKRTYKIKIPVKGYHTETIYNIDSLKNSINTK